MSADRREDLLHCKIPEPSESQVTAWESTVRLAERLGVDVLPDGETRPVMMIAPTGTERYDFNELIHALLDRMDSVAA